VNDRAVSLLENYEIEVLKLYPIMEQAIDFKKERKLKRLLKQNIK